MNAQAISYTGQGSYDQTFYNERGADGNNYRRTAADRWVNNAKATSGQAIINGEAYPFGWDNVAIITASTPKSARHTNTTTQAEQLPPLSAWSCYYDNGTQNSYDIEQDGVKYSIQPMVTDSGRLRGYSLTCFGYPGNYGHATIEPLTYNGKTVGTVYPFQGHHPAYNRAASAAKVAREAHAKRPC